MEDLPTFKTERLILRSITIDDAPSYEKNFVDYEVISQLSANVPWPYPENGIADYITNEILPKQGNDNWDWGIFLKDTPDEIIGVVALWREGKPENRGFWLGHEYWRKGYMTEAVKPVMDYAFNELAFEKLIFSNAVGNTQSRRIKEKTGARLLRTEAGEFVNPEYTEREVWQLTKEEWKGFSQN